MTSTIQLTRTPPSGFADIWPELQSRMGEWGASMLDKSTWLRRVLDTKQLPDAIEPETTAATDVAVDVVTTG